ncbi:hypothetical protein EGT49_06105 [Companilactobacillus suantsaicola]|uniref:Uncharacterized protein n=1 Tax=Companilactobacillus suantsaicola TaxID=2487723 RepID=A0A4Z0JKK5_9LACO|nr:hypothetical protein EGT49_06105 [Companilactobacillus suantsaicola]
MKWNNSVVWVVGRCRLPQQLWETLERSGHNLEPIPKAGIVFKIGLPLGAESAKRNFRAEHFPELLLQTRFQFFAVFR